VTCKSCEEKDAYIKTLELIIQSKGFFFDVQKCFIKHRAVDDFKGFDLQSFPVRIHNYAIIPMEDFEALGGEEALRKVEK